MPAVNGTLNVRPKKLTNPRFDDYGFFCCCWGELVEDGAILLLCLATGVWRRKKKSSSFQPSRRCRGWRCHVRRGMQRQELSSISLVRRRIRAGLVHRGLALAKYLPLGNDGNA